MSEHVLVINAGSSSIKYQLIDTGTREALAGGLLERIGQPTGGIRHDGPDGRTTFEAPLGDHAAGIAMLLQMFAEHGPQQETWQLVAVGHRVVQGGDRFPGPVLVDDRVEQEIEELCTLAPLHNPPNLAGIRAARRAFPDVPHGVVFDTSFHTTLPPRAYRYAIPRDLAEEYAIRRYGAHGTSHKYVSERAAELLGRRPAEVNVIVAHLGNGASITAVQGGRSIETSMGLTPLEGLVMGTRSGDIDPAVVFHLARVAGMGIDDLDNLLNRRSGMLGLTGSSDLRDVHARAEAGDPDAELALEIYCHRLKKYLGAYYALLGRVDAVAFTAGVGENDDVVRSRTMSSLEHLGMVLDAERNLGRKQSETLISTDTSPVAIYVIPTNEEYEIARQIAELVRG